MQHSQKSNQAKLTQPDTNDRSFQCAHCFQSFKYQVPVKFKNLNFCCRGCQAVYSFLQDHHLNSYYNYQEKTSAVDELGFTQTSESSEYSFLDQKEFRSEKIPDLSLDFYLENAHCASCVWLIDQLPDVLSNEVEYSCLNISTKVARIKVKPTGSFERVIGFLKKTGYRAQPLIGEESLSEIKKKESGKLLFQLGVAAACAGNIMVLTTALYSGADQFYKVIFEWLVFILSLPVLFYSSTSFYSGAWRSLLSKRISIDVPIVLALIGAGTLSFWNLIVGSNQQYFDSLVVFVFLLLFGRLIQKKVEENVFSRVSFERLGQPRKARIAQNGDAPFLWADTYSEKLKPGDIIQVLPGEVIPADGIILEGNTYLRLSFLTGETEPVPVQRNSKVYSGGVNLLHAIVVKVEKTGVFSRLGEILYKVQNQVFQSKENMAWVDKISRYFLWAIFSLCIFIILVSFIVPVENVMNRVLALLIVACPCAIAIASPLTYALMISAGVKNGIYILKTKALEGVLDVRNIFFDKTGTLTSGEFQVLNIIFYNKCDQEEVKNAIVSLEANSTHPIAKAIIKYLQKDHWVSLINVDNFKSIELQGVQGEINGKIWRILSKKNTHMDNFETIEPEVILEVFCDSHKCAEIKLSDSIKQESAFVMNYMKSKGINSYIISGDKSKNCKWVAAHLSIPVNRVYSGQTPEDKKNVVSSFSNTIMCGDGVNDAFALSAANVGIALHGGIESCVNSSDVYLQNNDLRKILSLFALANSTRTILRRNFVLSLVYNVLGITGALLGLITPLIAALLMPLSSITVILSTLYGSWQIEGRFKKL